MILYSFKTRRDRMLQNQNLPQMARNELNCCEGDDEDVGESESTSQDAEDVSDMSTSVSTKSSQAEIVMVPGSIHVELEQGDKAAWLKVMNMFMFAMPVYLFLMCAKDRYGC